jgi:hypothetical protein
MCGPARFSYNLSTDLPILSVAHQAHPAITIERLRGAWMRRRELLLFLATGMMGARAVRAQQKAMPVIGSMLARADVVIE